MKKSIVISMALFAFAFGANASVVSLSRARNVARSWLVREGKAASVQAVLIQRSDVVQLPGLGDDAKYFAVKIKGGGTVVTSSDDEASPVVLFSDSAEEIDFSDVNSPANALLRKDYEIRQRATVMAAEAAKQPQISNDYRFYLDRQRMLERNRDEWARLGGDTCLFGEGVVNAGIAWYGRDDWFIKIYTANSLYDTRIKPIIQSRWNQSTVAGQACYNFYTPNEKDPFDAFGYAGKADNVVCGCVATALAQVLRYFAFDYEVTKTNEDFNCTYTYVTGVKTNITRRIQGGKYNWDMMTLVPELGARDGSFNVTNAMEIGKLCADCGAAVKMMYSKDGSGAYSSNAYAAFHSIFGYSSVRTDVSSGKIGTPMGEATQPVEPEKFPATRTNELQRVFYSNFDAGLPILVGLTGHQVVADGYGYSKDGLDYVHINMGWGGQCDLWYLLPNVSCDSNGRPEGNLMFFEDCAYNIFTTNAASDVVMSGRVVDDDYNPIEGAAVKICRPGDYDDPIAEFVTGENGIWGLIIAPGTYEVVASDEVVTEAETFSFSDNRWGCDIMLAPPAVRNLMQSAPTNEYTSLEKAIRAANTNDVLEVFARTRLKKNVTIDRDLTIKITDDYADDPTNCIIRVNNSSVITVAPGVRAEFDGLAFKSAAKTIVDVATNAVAAFSGNLGIGIVHTADTNGFEVCGAVDFIDGYELRVDCDEAKAEGDRFGSWTCSAADKDTANRVLNQWNLDLGGIANDDGSLVWGVVAVDPRIAVAYIDDGSGTPVYYRTLDNLFRNLPEGDLDIKITQDAKELELKNPVNVTDRHISISSDGGAFSISGITAKNGGFIVGEGGELTFEDVTIEEFTGEWFVRIPEDGGDFTLGENALLRDLNAVGKKTDGLDFPNGLIVMCGGKMNMKPNSLIAGCSYQNGLGSVIALYGGVLDINGGSIIGCSAELDGAAIRYEPVFEGAGLLLSGHVDINGNQINDTPPYKRAGDICLVSDEALVAVAGDITSDFGIGICGVHSDISNFFGRVSGTLSNPEVFFRDGNETLEKPFAAILSDGNLLWDYAKETYGQCDPSEATVLVTYVDSGDVLYYDNIATAVNNIYADANIVLTADQYLNTDAVISYKVGIDGDGFSIIREGPGEIKVVSGGDLTLGNVTITGYDVDHPWYYYVVGSWYLFAEFRGSDHQIIEVDGGRLTLGYGTDISMLGHDQVVDKLFDVSDPYFWDIYVEYNGDLYPYGAYLQDDYYRASCAVVAWNGAEVVMEDGAEIHDCWNYFYEDPVNCGATAGIIIEASVAHLRGGSISGSVSAIGPAVDVCQGVDKRQSVVYLGSGFVCKDNTDMDGAISNFRLEDLSKLYLESEFTGKLGYTSGYFANTNRATEVITNLTETEVAASAVLFHNDVTGADGVGVVSEDGSGYLVVWSTCIGADGKFYEVNDDGTTNVWTRIGEIPDPPDPPDPPEPTYIVTTNDPTAIAFMSIVRLEAANAYRITLTNLVKDANYSIYTVTSLDGGFDIGTLAPVTNFNAEADGPYTLTVLSTTPGLFWKASGKTTYITNYLGGATH